MRGIQSNTMILCAPGNRGASLLSRRGRTYSPPRRGGGIACGNCALCEADAASAEALWTMSHHGGAAVIVHADGFIFCFISRTVVSVLETTCRLPVKNINLMFFTAMGIASSATPIFFLRKRNKKAEGRKDGENEWLSTTWKQRWSAEVRGVLRLPLPLI